MSDDQLDEAEAMLPGPELVALLSTLGQTADLRMLAQWTRAIGWIEAQLIRGTEQLLGRGSEDDWRMAEADLGVALRLSPLTAQARLGLADRLVYRLPRTLEALEQGRIPLTHAKLIADETQWLEEDEQVTRVEIQALQVAADLSRAELFSLLRKLVLAIDPEAVQRRRKDAKQGRSVRVSPADPDGMATLSARLTADEAVRAKASIDAKAEQDDSSQADAFMGLVTGDLPVQAEVAFRIGEDGPVTVPGIGALDLDSLVALFAKTCKVTIRPYAMPTGERCVPEQRYQPSDGLRGYVEALHPTCVFPHCNRQARKCDLDHVKPWGAGGTTCPCNLLPECRFHHRLKTFLGWRPVIVWVDPHGNIHGPPLQ